MTKLLSKRSSLVLLVAFLNGFTFLAMPAPSRADSEAGFEAPTLPSRRWGYWASVRAANRAAELQAHQQQAEHLRSERRANQELQRCKQMHPDSYYVRSYR